MKKESIMILIFGATGDLTRRKLIPSLYHLVRKDLLTNCTPIICVGRKDLSRQEFIDRLNIEKFIEAADPEVLERLLARIEYMRFNVTSDTPEDFTASIANIQERYSCADNKLIYLALPTSAFQRTAELISSLGKGQGWRRMVFEKPFGEDLKSAKELNENIRAVLNESEIYRVDHYLGKQLVQNILTLRFGNEIFSGAWQKRAIDHVQITVSETLGVEKRAGYYDKSGAVRDMVQNHLLQLLSFLAMEPPKDDTPDALRDEAVRVLQRLQPLNSDDVVLGQYGEGTLNGEKVAAYQSEDGVADDSVTETFAAIRVYIENDRWQGVPFYLRTGKRMAKRYAEIRIVFQQRRRYLIGSNGDPNMIIIRIQPDTGIALAFNVQTPHDDYKTESVMMDFCHHCHFGPNTPEAYESILRNVLEGDHSLFPRRDWIEASWEYIDRLYEVAQKPKMYAAGCDGPAEAMKLLKSDGREWLTDENIATAPAIKDFR
ncbi:glucose-6-phosphate dehydrogenase [Desulfosediminicola ganghwensis]|uniref:glucose-6-phosphate dehydrogenase n=1 Tax=Desulfosediminicola ganghwensis TaxID=2569540 RepID=UPI0010AB9F70|nr:glucose-6-phosphate dehydrogenase [Desulfosediminicola ganghwensis]